MQPAEEEADESSDDGGNEQSNLNGGYIFNNNGYDVTCREIMYMHLLLMLLKLLLNTVTYCPEGAGGVSLRNLMGLQ